jgi:hypothetical protein
MEVGLSNHCCRGKAVSITQSEFGSAEHCSGYTTVSAKVATTLRIEWTERGYPSRHCSINLKGGEG